MTKAAESIAELAHRRTRLQGELAELKRATPEHQEKKLELDACKAELAAARRQVVAEIEPPKEALARLLVAVRELEKIDVSEPDGSALQQIDACRMALRSFALGVHGALDARNALLEAARKIDGMSDTQRAALAQVLMAKSVPSAEAFGVPSSK